MKNYYLLKIACVSMLTFGLLTSCSDDDSETMGNEDDTDTESSISDNDMPVTAADNNIELSNCYSCPSFSLEQTTASNPEPIIINVPAGTVCEGDDGKAYIDGVLNELNQSYDEYLRIRQMSTRCSKME